METRTSGLFYIIEESETPFSSVNAGGRIQATGFLPGKLTRHYIEHGQDFGVPLTDSEYENKAISFFGQAITKDIYWFRDAGEYLYKYDRKQNEFGICSPDGFVITYYKPENGIKYWYGQVQKYGI